MTLSSALCFVPRGSTEGCSYWRVWSPVTHIERQGGRCGWAYYDDDRAADHVLDYDVVVFQRLGWNVPRAGRQLRESLHSVGKVMIQECDDDIWTNRADQKSQREMGLKEHELSPTQNRRSTKIYDGVLVSTERLRTVVRGFAPDLPCEVVGNYIDLTLWRELLKDETRHPAFEGKLVIGWAGGNRKSRDLEPVAEAWRRVAEARPGVHFAVQGYLDPVMRAAVPEGRLDILPWLPVIPRDGQPFYGAGLINFDIACCAVAQTAFNASKTPIKALESAAAGAAVVATPWLYGAVIDNGRTGLLAETADEWERALLALVDDEETRRGLAGALYSEVEARWSMERNWWRWPAAWTNLAQAARERLRQRVA